MAADAQMQGREDFARRPPPAAPRYTRRIIPSSSAGSMP
jgi:hypothetical protein